MKLKDLKMEQLGEDNSYVFVRDDGIAFEPVVSRNMYHISMWRLVLGRQHGTPMMEKVAECCQTTETEAFEEADETLLINGWTALEFTDEEFAEKTGSSLSVVDFEG